MFRKKLNLTEKHAHVIDVRSGELIFNPLLLQFESFLVQVKFHSSPK